MDILAKELFSLQDAARKLLRQAPDTEQVIVLKTAGKTVFQFPNDPYDEQREAENRFLQALQDGGDIRISYLVCMWKTGGVDVPSMHFRQQLLELCRENGEAFVLLQGEAGPVAKKLKELF